MVQPPLFQRSPRLPPELPGGEAEIPGPPPAPAPPGLTLWSVVLMVAPGLASALIMFLVSQSTGMRTTSYLLFSLPMILVSASIQLTHFVIQKRKHGEAAATRISKYRELLARFDGQFGAERDRQRQALLEIDPDLHTCLDRAVQRAPSLWERAPTDPDFLRIRLGTGRQPFSVTIKPPRIDQAIDPDPLLQEAAALAERYTQVDGSPIALPLLEAGVSGVVGPRAAALNAARSIILHAATHHAPDELKVVLFFRPEEADDWAWVRWLPHTWRGERKERLLAADEAGALRLLQDLQEALGRRKTQPQGEGVPPLPIFLVVLADLALAERHPALGLLLREGGALGAVTLLLAQRREDLPMECRAMVEVGPGAGQLIMTGPTRYHALFQPEEAEPELAEAIARALAPLRLRSMAAPAEVPAQVGLLSLLELGNPAQTDIVARWSRSAPERSLAVPLGLKAGGEPLILDLSERGDGPHGLVAGATGSGKSELLQTLIVAHMAQFHPHEVSFMIVDFKGGGMAQAFEGVPHLIGVLTNLEGNLARRALVALQAELKRRQRILGGRHIDEYLAARRRGEPLAPLPHLIIVVDEFAELKAQRPEFMQELVSAVRVGRSLGIHLILATQKPAGVVDEQIWSNTRFRLCLRVERPQDSQEVLKSPEAAFLRGAGRGYLQVGNNERFELFQAGYGGAPYRADGLQQTPVQALYEVALHGARISLVEAAPVAMTSAGPAELTVLLQAVREQARSAGIEPLAGPWLPPLPDRVHLPAASHGWDGIAWRSPTRWLQPVIGLLDDPENQSQQPLAIPLGTDGHLAVYGAPQSGKSTLLQTLGMALALAHSPADLHLYLLDGSGRGLGVLEPLPHVGALLQADEGERLARSLRQLAKEAERRKERWTQAGVNSLAAFRQATREPLPAIVLLIDDYPALASAQPEWEEGLIAIARDGASLGIYLVITATAPNLVRSRLASSITQAVALQLAERSDYGAVVGRTGGMEPAAVPGRGLLRATPPLEFQTALPAEGATDWERSAALRGLAEEMASAWDGPLPPPVRALPEVLSLHEVGAPAALGWEADDLAPFTLPLNEGPHFVVTGPPSSGKTSCLLTLGLALAEAHPPDRLRLWLVDPSGEGLSQLAGLPHVAVCVQDQTNLEAELTALWEPVGKRRPDLLDLLLMDDLDLLKDGAPPAALDRLEQMVRRERRSGIHLVLAGSLSAFQQAYSGLPRTLRDGQTGVLVGTSDQGDLGVLGARLPASEAGKPMAPGLGFYVRRGRLKKVLLATAGTGDGVNAWVERIRERWCRG